MDCQAELRRLRVISGAGRNSLPAVTANSSPAMLAPLTVAGTAGGDGRGGDLVTVALPGDFGKPRPALVIQFDLFAGHATVTVLPVTSTDTPAPLFRIPVEPSADSGLRELSFVMVDKAMSIRMDKLGPPFGRLGDADLIRVNRVLVLFLGIVS